MIAALETDMLAFDARAGLVPSTMLVGLRLSFDIHSAIARHSPNDLQVLRWFEDLAGVCRTPENL